MQIVKLFYRPILIISTLLSLEAFGADLILSGAVISDNEKIITSRFMGFINSVNVSEGDKIKKGTLLYSIDSKEIDSSKRQINLSIQQAELSYRMHQNQHDNLVLNLKRHKRLYAKDMVSKADVENLELSEKNLLVMMEIALKQIEQAKEHLKEVDNQYQYLHIKAPNDGVIIKSSIKVGEMAMPGMPAMVLSDLSDLKIASEIGESNLNDIHIDKNVSVSIPSIELEAKGRVYSIIPSSNPMTHSYKIKVDFDIPDREIYPGMFATIRVK